MFKVFYLSNCTYSKKTINTITKLKLLSDLIECDNNKYINFQDVPNNYLTYPKVLFKTDKKTIFIGGNEEFQNLIILLEKLKKNINYKIEPQKYIKKKDVCNILIELTN